MRDVLLVLAVIGFIRSWVTLPFDFICEVFDGLERRGILLAVCSRSGEPANTAVSMEVDREGLALLPPSVLDGHPAEVEGVKAHLHLLPDQGRPRLEDPPLEGEGAVLCDAPPGLLQKESIDVDPLRQGTDALREPDPAVQGRLKVQPAVRSDVVLTFYPREEEPIEVIQIDRKSTRLNSSH